MDARLTRFVGHWTWVGVRAGSRWTWQHGAALSVRAGNAVGGSAREWARDRAMYGLRTPLVTLTTPEGTKRVPRWDVSRRTAVMLGDEEAPIYRAAGDEQLEADRVRIHADATRLDHQPATTDTPAEQSGANKENDMTTTIGEGPEALDNYHIESPHDLPYLYERAAKEMARISERINTMREDNQAHRVPPGVLSHITAAAEDAAAAAESFGKAKAQMEEHLEYVPTYGSDAA